ncbi:MAG: hypothetical protein AAGA17_03025 [Actinomycetota bacterium]
MSGAIAPSEEVRRRPDPRWWVTPPGRPSTAALLIGLGIGLVAASDPGVDLRWLGAGLLVCVPLGLAWTGRFVASGVVVVGVYDRRWAIAPALVMAALLIAASGLPVRARFEVDRAEFESYRRTNIGTELPQDWVQLPDPGRIGTFEIDSVIRAGESIVLWTSTPHFGVRSGFAYAIDGPEELGGYGRLGDASLRSLGGGWYAFVHGL